MRISIVLLTALLSALWSPFASAAGNARHVVMVVWDGMRPDFVSEKTTPTLYQLARGGVTFQNHHPVYLSATEVNGTALATGAYPGHSSVIANKEFRPDIDPCIPIGTEALAAVRKGDEISHGAYLKMPTVAETLQRAGRKTIVAGVKPVALLHDRAARADASAGVNLFDGKSLPAPVAEQIIASQGTFPAALLSKIARDEWTTRALIGTLWKDEVPAFTMLWLSEPDYSQHATGPGSARSLEAIASSDHNLSLVLDALKAKGVRDQTDIFVVSDHGFSTIGSKADVLGALKAGGFNATRDWKKPATKGDVLMVGNGGSVLLYVAEHDAATVARLVEFLQQQDFTGVIFTREPAKGAFTLEQGRLNSPQPPDVVVSMRWSPDKSATGAPGLVTVDGSGAAKGGMHVSLGRTDMHNILFAAGPDFRRGFVSTLPSGNVDVAPTVLWLLGVKPLKPMDGRVLTEAFASSQAAASVLKTDRLEATRDLGKAIWRQFLTVSTVNGTAYFDEGGSTITPK